MDVSVARRTGSARGDRIGYIAYWAVTEKFMKFRFRFRRAETSCESSILDRRGSEVGRLGCEPWLRARRAGMKTRVFILSAHISFSINMTGIIRRAYARSGRTIRRGRSKARPFSILTLPDRRITVKTCPMKSKRPELFGVSYAPTATHRAATTGDPTCTRSPATLHTHGLTDTHRSSMREP
jgi:hypothetical protein